MNVKIDTKEKFCVITPEVNEITANMSDELSKCLSTQLSKPVPHAILNLHLAEKIDDSVLTMIYEMQQKFYNDNNSFVICGINKGILNQLEALELLDTMNITPSESEAWDIVQMEEIERELLNGFDEN
jgi:anti-anti-sigma regulatory factor